MIAHIFHDTSGTIKSVVLQGTEVEGELSIQPVNEDELVTAVDVDLDEVFRESAVGTGAGPGSSGHHLNLIARDIRSGFRLDVQRKTLERLK
jgi:hypothetical protein